MKMVSLLYFYVGIIKTKLVVIVWLYGSLLKDYDPQTEQTSGKMVIKTDYGAQTEQTSGKMVIKKRL